jgi:hypothetical protein
VLGAQHHGLNHDAAASAGGTAAAPACGLACASRT